MSVKTEVSLNWNQEGLPASPCPLASRSGKRENTVIQVGGLEIGGPKFVVMAGPCSVEDQDQLLTSARIARKGGAAILRGGAFKPRSSPYSFQGLAEEGLKLLDMARRMTGLLIVTEVMDSMDLPLVESYADILQVGARNIQNFSLLKRLGKSGKPVLLKRGLMTTVDELLMSAEYILAEGNDQVILCERGIRTFETSTRNTLDISAVPVLKEKTHLPVIVDPSHAAGHWKYILPLSLAAVAAGSDGLMIEVHPHPEQALCDGEQSLRPELFLELMDRVRSLACLMNREM